MAHYAKAPTIDLTYGVSLRSVKRAKQERRDKAIANYIKKNYPEDQPTETKPKPSIWNRFKSLLNIGKA